MNPFSSRLRKAVGCFFVLAWGLASVPSGLAQGYAFRTLAGAAGVFGRIDGPANLARFGNPTGLALDRDGNLFVADAGSSTIRLVATNGWVSTLAGTPGWSGYADGSSTNAMFYEPTGVAVDSTGVAYVGDTYGFLVRKISPDLEVSTLAGFPGRTGTADGLVVDSAGNIYVLPTSCWKPAARPGQAIPGRR